MKQYVKPDLRFIGVPEDLLTISTGTEQANGAFNITFDWDEI